ncbi:YraN family protein [Thermomicrobiaceae bacterium CFH 74404]|uniref:UPF0102 protein NET02_08355 n=1 Tax=Thermalbibacter longus TaxID=2951981 RepID=A0AA41WEL3_9BACT|nr:YraN family protein [Thermalbibacter longus]MCM8749154.1 YraN family protein [Thermalbibacter longus]
MNRQRHLGRRGEEHAARWLQERGWVILDRNWRGSAGELDVVALDGEVLVGVEVKLRRGEEFGAAEEAITPSKLTRLLQTTSEYLLHHAEHSERLWRVDLLAITLDARGRVQRVIHVENAVTGE